MKWRLRALYVLRQSVECWCWCMEGKRNVMRCNAMQLRGDWYCYDEDFGGEGRWTFLLPPARHHLVILSTAYRLLLPIPALTIPLTVWIVEGYLTICLISLKWCQ